jgi:predicted AAA+ superfamily ATPase
MKRPVIDDQKKNLLDAIEDADSDTLIFVYGLAGVGKSTLRHSVNKTLTNQMMPEFEIQQGT